ncbi:signal peptidase II [Nocardioides limicola]|uniref:signal peptidase II n=1 Tax=Nocardioides limicola TaxID=2803368 RepID=UPI00193B4394|nr:signal peptidase II [Nocardioides sp. DJM-14]
MQAASGAPLISGEHTTSQSHRPRRGLFAATAVTAYVIDIVTKVLAVEHLSGRPDVELVGSFLTLHLTRNPGAAFSFGTGFSQITVVLTGVALIAAVVMLVLSLRLRDRIWALGLGLALAGVLGNLTDRLFREPGPFRGHVVDFLQLPNWPVFNVADMCINVGIGLIVLQILRGIHRDGSREERAA